MKQLLYLLLLTLFVVVNCEAQKIFSEGIIKYDVYRNNGKAPEGIFVVTVKAGMIKQELAMNNGFNNITIYNQKTGITLSLSMREGAKYAMEISLEELKEKNKRFENANLTPTQNSKKIASYHTKGMQVNYTSGDVVEIFYTPELTVQNTALNTMFPGLGGIALEYVTKSSKDLSFKFIATQIDIQPVDISVFNIPSDYKIVTKAELEKLK